MLSASSEFSDHSTHQDGQPMSPECPEKVMSTREWLNVATDEQLLSRVRHSGDILAFEQLVHRYERPLFRYLLRYLHDASLADDILQATLLRLYQRCDTYIENRPVRPWLYSIATHLAVDALRSKARHATTSLDAVHGDDEHEERVLRNLLEITAPSPLEELEIDERAQWIRKEVQRLPERLRIVVLLIYFEGLTFHEVAEVLQLPLGTVKTRVHAALKILHEAWDRDRCCL
jgi:RNA polymerase sigma-70 factor (ECF subfamily)